MKRLNPETNKPFRCGDFNAETGQYFRGYNKGRIKKNGTYVELWICPESFHAIRERMKLRARERRKRDAFKRVRSTEQLIDDLYKPVA